MKHLVGVACLAWSSAACAQVGFWELPTGGVVGRAWDANFDGSVVVGEVRTTALGQAARWVNRDLELLPGGQQALATDASGDVIVGPNFRWTAQGGNQPLGPVPGCPGALARGQDVSQDGSIIIGTSICPGPSPGLDHYEAFRWTQATGLVLLGLPSNGNGVSGMDGLSSGTRRYRRWGLVPRDGLR